MFYFSGETLYQSLQGVYEQHGTEKGIAGLLASNLLVSTTVILSGQIRFAGVGSHFYIILSTKRVYVKGLQKEDKQYCTEKAYLAIYLI